MKVPERYHTSRAEKSRLLSSWQVCLQLELLEHTGEVAPVDLREVPFPHLWEADILAPIPGSQHRNKMAVTALHLVKSGLKTYERDILLYYICDRI